MKIPLFDIDWTLLKGGNTAHVRSFEYAIKKIYGLEVSTEKFFLEGKIDNQIIVELLKYYGVSKQESLSKLPQVTQAMYDYFMDHLDEGVYQPMPGALKILAILKSKGIPIGLLSGNLEKIAKAKLEKAKILNYFSIGAFGSTAFKRVALIKQAEQKAKSQGIKNPEFVLVGDSLLDVKCAKDGGVPIIAVATGKSSADELKAAKADLVLESLTQKNEFLNFLKL